MFKFIDFEKTKFKFKFIDFEKMKLEFKFIDFEKTKFKFKFMKNALADSNSKSIQLQLGPTLRLFARVTHLRRNVAAVASRQQHRVRFNGPGEY